MAMPVMIPYATFKKLMVKHKMHLPGHAITMTVLDRALNNTLPANPTCKDCRDQELHRLTYVDRFRNEGLLKGRYTGKDGNVIRTYDRQYNHAFMQAYTKKASNAIVRGLKLNDSTPLVHMHHKSTNSKHFDVALKALDKVK